MDLLEAKKTLRAHGYTLLKESSYLDNPTLTEEEKKDVEDFADYMVDEIERYLEGCEFLEGTIDKGKPSVRNNHIIISVYFPKTRWNAGEIRQQLVHFQYTYNQKEGNWTFDDGNRYRGGTKLNLRNYTIETLEDMDNQLGWELQKQ